MNKKIVVSISGGKDSQAVAILAFEQFPKDSIRLVVAETDNEHPLTYEHLNYLRDRFEHPIDVVRNDFAADLARKAKFCLEKWPERGVPLETCRRAAAILKPTGYAFLDLCLLKGRFPSRKAQFCTQELKRIPLDRYMFGLVSQKYHVESWQGVRKDESRQRQNLIEHEETPEGWIIMRPILDWTAQEVVQFSLDRGIKLNPLYSMGFNRVGCAPCINSGKDDVLGWEKRAPEVIDRIEEWETLVAQASKWGESSFFAAPTKNGRADRQGRNIREYVEWAKTSHGGRQYDLVKAIPPLGCASSYGLCE